MSAETITVDGNEAAADVAYRVAEVVAIYPITPSSPMAELADAWSVEGKTNLWGTVPRVVQMQSEGGVAGAVHGALQTGALTTTFTASQGLLLMMPNMFKIAGELTSAVIHVAARTVATHALSIFGDHSDVMAVRSTGWAMLCASSVQEAHDFALISTAASLKSRVPFVHFFDGFRTSHELNKISRMDDTIIRALIDERLVHAHRERGLTPDRPVLRGSAQNADVFFQAREASNPFYEAVPRLVRETMDEFGAQTGRRYRPVEYVGAPDATRVVVLMGSGCGAAEEAVEALLARGERVGMVKVRLYRPFDGAAFAAALPPTIQVIGVLDRTKEPGAPGEPLYQDVVTALVEQRAQPEAGLGSFPIVVGGRYGLASKEFTPAMVAGVFAELATPNPMNHFTVGIVDDVSHSSVPYEPAWHAEPAETVRAVFYGLGSDGTVGANKNTVKIIGEQTPLHAQGYFVYDSRKSGATTVSHLRFSPSPIRSTYQVRRATFVACHQFHLLDQFDVLELAEDGATFLLNSPYGPEDVWDHLNAELQRDLIKKKIRFFVVDASRVASEAGLGSRINTVLQTCFFAISGVLPTEEAISQIKAAVRKSYVGRGERVVERNYEAIDAALAGLREVPMADRAPDGQGRPPVVPADAPDFVQRVTAMMLAGKGDLLPVSALPVDGTFPLGTARWEKRGIASEIPIWDPSICIECAKCALVCPHAAIRMKVFKPSALAQAPAGYRHRAWSGHDRPGAVMTIQVAPDDCTGCGICVDVCPARDKSMLKHKSINMEPRSDHLQVERESFDFFTSIPAPARSETRTDTIKGSQMIEPLFEFSGACAGCGETPYLKLLTQMFGDRLLVANATGCSSIYGGNLPTTPWSIAADGRGPAWSNSLFEDNAEFGLGMRLAIDQQTALAQHLLRDLAGQLPGGLAMEIIEHHDWSDAGIARQRARVADLKRWLETHQETAATRDLAVLADFLVKKSVWIVGGDGWAYDIGFGGLDHVLATGKDVNILVLDTEVYSNTGGQASKSTPRAAVAKFASSGKRAGKKDLGMIASAYGNVYVASVALGADNAQTLRAFAEAEAHHGPSIIIAYSHCIAHGIEMRTAMSHQREAVQSGYWPLFRFKPTADEAGAAPLHLDSKKPTMPFRDFAAKEARFEMLKLANPHDAERLAAMAQADIDERWRLYEQLAVVERTAPGVLDETPGEGIDSPGEPNDA